MRGKALVLAALGAGLTAALVARRRPGSSQPPADDPGGTPPAPGLVASEPRILTLREPMRPLVRALITDAWRAGLPVLVTSAYRSAAEQDALYEQGRSEPGPVVTGLRGGQSWHNYGLAVDLAVLDGQRASWPNDVGLWTALGELGEALGLRWGGRFPSPDWGHFELRLPGVGPGQSPPGVV